MKISVLIPYRNKDKNILKKCLEALQAQDYPDFEVILIDYGSDKAVSQEAKSLCAAHSRVRYIYSEARGYFWSCSQAFNQGVYYAQGDYLVMLDVDLIVLPYFLQFCVEQCRADEFLIFKVIYLPEGFKDWQSLQQKPEQYLGYEYSDYGGLGNIFVKKEKLLQTGGYDSFYRVWGEEDRDMVRKLEKIGLRAKKITPDQLPIFHQWHPKASAALPKGWQKTILAHAQKNIETEEQDSQSVDFQGIPVYLPKDRPALEYLNSERRANKAGFEFEFPIEHSYVRFIRRFGELKSKEHLYISQHFSEIKPQQGSRLGKLLRKINSMLARWSLSYRLVEIATAETELIYSSVIADYVFYFLLEFEEQIADYYFEAKGEHVFLILIKK